MNTVKLAVRSATTRVILFNPISKVLIAIMLFPMFAHESWAQTVKDVYSFNIQNSSRYPQYVALTQGRDGRLYGTTCGLCGPAPTTNGSVFRVTTGGLFAELLAFDGTNGRQPAAGVTLASDGNFYGTTNQGGPNTLGVLFRISPDGAFTLLQNFGLDNSGEFPAAVPVEVSDGVIYGTTSGSQSDEFPSLATAYQYTRSGAFNTITLFSFDVLALGPLVQGADGALYGTSVWGGTYSCGFVFKLSTAGLILKSYSFPCGAGGANPVGPLLQASDGNFYGVTNQQGAFGLGTIFKMTPDFAVSILHNFQGALADGEFPSSGGLVQATDGNIYGVTSLGGPAGAGTIFQFSTSGGYKSIYGFTIPVGQYPDGLVQHTNGKFYGTATNGGTNGLGAVFSFDMGLTPFVTFVRASGRVGNVAQILGQGLKGTSSVTFNGVPARNFLAGTDTYIRVVIPRGATTGPVLVTTPTGVLTSNKDFRIVP